MSRRSYNTTSSRSPPSNQRTDWYVRCHGTTTGRRFSPDSRNDRVLGCSASDADRRYVSSSSVCSGTRRSLRSAKTGAALDRSVLSVVKKAAIVVAGRLPLEAAFRDLGSSLAQHEMIRRRLERVIHVRTKDERLCHPRGLDGRMWLQGVVERRVLQKPLRCRDSTPRPACSAIARSIQS